MKNYKGILLIGLTLISIALSANIKFDRPGFPNPGRGPRPVYVSKLTV